MACFWPHSFIRPLGRSVGRSVVSYVAAIGALAFMARKGNTKTLPVQRPKGSTDQKPVWPGAGAGVVWARPALVVFVPSRSSHRRSRSRFRSLLSFGPTGWLWLALAGRLKYSTTREPDTCECVLIPGSLAGSALGNQRQPASQLLHVKSRLQPEPLAGIRDTTPALDRLEYNIRLVFLSVPL